MLNKFKILVIILLGVFFVSNVSPVAGAVNIPGEKIKEASINYTPTSGNPIDNINDIGFSILNTVKIVLEGVLFIFMVYVGVQMIMAMGSDEEMLTNSKRQIWYTLIALVFINIPGTIYNAFYNDTPESIGSPGPSGWRNSGDGGNIFLDIFDFGITVNDSIIGFIKVLIFAIAVFMIILAGIRIMTARGKEEAITEGKNKVIFSVIAIILVGFIESWKFVAFNGVISDGVNFFATLANLALFFAGPVAIFFLTLAGFYFVTANGDEERIKKAKSIVINVVIATLIILAAYTFLLDLATLG